ncbi:MAG: hypothetical protein WBY94_00715 [Polyangiaceae bacterium]
MANLREKLDFVACPECKRPTHNHTATLYDNGEVRRIVVQHRCAACGYKWSHGSAKALGRDGVDRR